MGKKRKKKTFIGLEKGKVYIIKCLRSEVTPQAMRELAQKLYEEGIKAIVISVETINSIVVQEHKEV